MCEGLRGRKGLKGLGFKDSIVLVYGFRAQDLRVEGLESAG